MRSLGVDAHVNEINDICVGFNKISLFRNLAFTFLFWLLGKKAFDSHWFGQSVDYFMMFRHISLIVSSFTCSELSYVCPFLRLTYLFFTARFWLSVQNRIPAGIPPRDHVNFNEAWSSWGYVASRRGIISSYSRTQFPFLPAHRVLILWVNPRSNIEVFFINDWKGRLPQNSLNFSSGSRVY